MSLSRRHLFGLAGGAAVAAVLPGASFKPLPAAGLTLRIHVPADYPARDTFPLRVGDVVTGLPGGPRTITAVTYA